MPDDDPPARVPETQLVPEKDTYEPPEAAWWLFIPGASIALIIDAIWQAIFPHKRREADLQFCRYYHFAEIPRGKHARLKLDGGPAGLGEIEVFVTPPGQPLPPAPGTSPRVRVAGNGEMSVYGPGVLTLHQAKAFPPPAPPPVKVRMTLEDD